MRIISFSFSFKHLVPESIICYLCVVGYRTTCSSSLLLCWLRDCHVSSVSAKHLFIYFNKFVLFLSQIFSSAAFQQEEQAGYAGFTFCLLVRDEVRQEHVEMSDVC